MADAGGPTDFDLDIRNYTLQELLDLLKFPASVGGDLQIEDYAFGTFAGSGDAISVLTTVTFPASVGGYLRIEVSAFETASVSGNVTSALTTVTFPASAGGTLTIMDDAFRGHDFAGAIDNTKGVYFPTISYTGITVSGTPFSDAEDGVQLNGSGDKLKIIDISNLPQPGRYYK